MRDYTPGYAILAAALAAAATPLALAEGAPAALLACAAEKDDARRLACYDAEVARLGQGMPGPSALPPGPTAAPAAAAAAAAPAAAAVPSPVAAANPLSEEEKFGLRGDLKQEKMPELQALEAVVTKVATKPQGELILTLDNGQVWSEIAPYSGIQVKVGDRVRITRGALRSFNLAAPNGRSSKVRRVR